MLKKLSITGHAYTRTILIDTFQMYLREPSCSFNCLESQLLKTRSHPEMVGDMSRVTLNSDLSKISFVHF